MTLESRIVPKLSSLVVPIDTLRPHPKNPNVGRTDLMLESLTRNKQFKPIVVGRGGIILGGNHTYFAAMELGWPDIAAVYVDVDWDSEEGKAITLADNEIGRRSTTEDGLLADLLQSMDQPTLGTGYDDETLAKLLDRIAQPMGKMDADEVPAVPETPYVKAGDLWRLGAHRLLCGDATQIADVRRALGETAASMVLTDPPYGVGIGAKNRMLQTIDPAGRRVEDLEGDEDIAAVEKLWRASFAVVRDAIDPGVPFYVFGPQGGDLGLLLLLLLRESGIPARHVLIWQKNRASFSMGRLDYDYAHEPVAYGWKKGGAHPWYASDPQTSLLAFDRPQASPDHATAKPVDLLARMIQNSSPINGVVLDPFGGSGSTLIAAHQHRRRCVMLEIEPRYCDVICRRYQEFASELPVLDATGEAHDFVSKP